MTSPPTPNRRAIHIQGARTHNLKNITCDIPHESLTVITGPSGSGKSSLAFDTLYAEGQRRFVESMSTYARQFLARIEKPDVDSIQHILPTIALEQKNHIKNARSTVGTATEVYDFLRLLYATIGETICPNCNHKGTKSTPETIEQQLKALPTGTKALVLSPIHLKDFPLKWLLGQGYFRILIDGETVELTEASTDLPDDLEIVIDRLVLKGDTTPTRLLESLRKALELNPAELRIRLLGTPEGDVTQTFRTQFSCEHCHTELTEPFPNLFSFNNPLGACPTCEGFGRIIGVDLDKVIPNRGVSLEDGAIHPFNTPANEELYDDLIREGRKRKIRLDVPFKDLTDAEKTFVLEGKGEYIGVNGFFEWLESKKYKVHVRVALAKYRGYYPCPECHSTRIRPEALRVVVGERNIAQLCNLSVAELLAFFEGLPLGERQQKITQRLMRELFSRLRYLNEIGLSYLTLARQSRTLSGGEAQRINLSSALGSALTDTLYVLDEPTVGLHARDTERLLFVLRSLRDGGNTVVVVEHDPDMILGADRVLDIGPTGGSDGGHVVFEGTIPDFLKAEYSQTAYYLNHPPVLSATTTLWKGPQQWMAIRGAHGNNLKNLDVRLPKNQLVSISGVSGSGKSTLVKQTLYATYQQALGNELTLEVAPCTALEGFEDFSDIVLVDQTPPGRSVRSNPVTYVKAYDEIRKLFAGTRQAQALGITASHFSFNSAGGRCETCQGLGTVTIDMQFMADVTVTCHDCQGQRFSAAVLAIEFEGKNIFNVLEMTVSDAMKFFARQPRVLKKLNPLAEIGLGYLHLGQSTSTLSGGEAQRLKLASYLPGGEHVSTRPTLFLFDEPTTGLHLTDIHTLVAALRRLLSVGHSVIAVEHNIEFLAQSDYLVDMGPEGGTGGGQIVAEGPIADVLNNPASFTAHYLAQRLSVTRTTPGPDVNLEALPVAKKAAPAARKRTPKKTPVPAS